MPPSPANMPVLPQVFDDNTGALEMATVHCIQPQTKHISIKYHHFQSLVDDGSIQMLTKEQPVALLRVHRLPVAVLGWDTNAEKGCDKTSYEPSPVLALFYLQPPTA
jgi:hypothetical protein